MNNFMEAWNDFYGRYIELEDDIDFVFLRYEDLLLHTQKVTRIVCGNRMGESFTLRTDPSKKYTVGRKEAILKYTNVENICADYEGHEDLIERSLNSDFMVKFRYDYKMCGI